MSKFFLYYDENNDGFILCISPVQLMEMSGHPYIKISEERGIQFIKGIEKLSNWKVDIVETPRLVKKDDFIIHQYDFHGFFDVENQKTEEPDINFYFNKNILIIKVPLHDEKITFFITGKNNPMYLLEKLILEPNVVEKKFILPRNEYSIFGTQYYGKIKCHYLP